MKRFLLIAVFLGLVAHVQAQVTSTNARRIPATTGVPTGSCISGPPWVSVDIRTTNGHFYACLLGVWTDITSSGGGITNSAGSNVVPKSDGTNIIASSITDNGTNVIFTENLMFSADNTKDIGASGGVTRPRTIYAGTSIISPIFSSDNADPADSGIVRLGNNENIAWEKATPGTDWTLGVNGSDVLTTNAPFAAPSISTGTSPPALTVGTGGAYALGEGTAATAAASVAVCYADSTSHTIKCAWNNGSFYSIPLVIAKGTVALGTTTVNAGACSGAIDGGTATGVVSTDVITLTPNTDPTGLTGYAPSTSGGLHVWAVPTTDHVSVYLCNDTASNITPQALTLNWSVIR